MLLKSLSHRCPVEPVSAVHGHASRREPAAPPKSAMAAAWLGEVVKPPLRHAQVLQDIDCARVHTQLPQRLRRAARIREARHHGGLGDQ